nr:unnamed protein product [Callosobruchus chinensis]
MFRGLRRAPCCARKGQMDIGGHN